MTKKIILTSALSLGLVAILMGTALAQTPLKITPKVKPPVSIKQTETTCMKSAVEKRETASQTAFDAYAAAIKSALTTRKTALLAAWDLTDKTQRKTAINNAWSAYKKARTAANSTLKQTRQTVWQQFTTDRKACGASPTGEDMNIDLAL